MTPKHTVYLFYEVKGRHNWLYVYGVDPDSLSMKLVAKKDFNFVSKMGYIAHGSKFYAIGGSCSSTGDVMSYLKDVYIFDQSKMKGGKEDEYNKWEKGPSLLAPKVSPAVVVVNHKIYVLNGKSYNETDSSLNGPLFEVLDLSAEGRWTKLPVPPFHSWYGNLKGPVIHGYTVIGNSIYVLAQEKLDYGDKMLFSFDVGEEKWIDHQTINVDEEVGKVLVAKALKSCAWDMNNESVDGILYVPDASIYGIRVRAIDLSCEQMVTQPKDTDLDMGGDSAPSGRYKIKKGERLFWELDHNYSGAPYVHLPLFIDPSAYALFDPLLTYLGDKRFLLVCTYHPTRKFVPYKRIVYSCILQLKEDGSTPDFKGPSSYAVIEKQKYKTMSSRLNYFTNWSSVLRPADK